LLVFVLDLYSKVEIDDTQPVNIVVDKVLGLYIQMGDTLFVKICKAFDEVPAELDTLATKSTTVKTELVGDRVQLG
jgi:hypothetical protein